MCVCVGSYLLWSGLIRRYQDMDQALYDKVYVEYHEKSKLRENEREEAFKKWKYIAEGAVAKGTPLPATVSIIKLASDTVR